MAATFVAPSIKDVQWLVDHARGEGLIVSCYADTSVASGIRPLWRERLTDEIKRIEQSLDDSPEARRTFELNITAINAALGRRTASTRGVAVFAAVQRDLLRVFELSAAPPDRLVVDEEPYLVPLLELLSRQRRYLVVHTDTHRGRLYTAVPGVVRLIEEISEDVPKRHRAAGQLWGKQQATIARHRMDHVLHYFKELVTEIERAWPEERYDGIVLLGAHEVLAEIRTHLPDHLARRIVREAPHAWAGRQTGLEPKVGAIHDEAVRRHDRLLIEEVKRRVSERHLIAAGPQEVIDALRNSQVGFPGSVVLEPDRGEAAARCGRCGSLFAHAADHCPVCGSPCETTNLWQAIALLAARHGIPVYFVGAGLGLQEYGGVVALLARDEPWPASPGPARPAAAVSGPH